MEMTNQGIYDLLCKIDRGYAPTSEEEELLETREELKLWNKKIQYLPDSIGRMRRLRSLDISDNNIKYLPDSICQLTMLEELNISSTSLSKLPRCIEKLISLKCLNLSYTMITWLPEWIGHLAELKSLLLGGTNISSLPKTIKQLSNLEELSLSNTKITALPISIGMNTALRSLDLCLLHLDPLPETIGKLTALEDLNLLGSNITKLPDSIGNLTALTDLNLLETQITTLPESIGRLSSLKKLLINGPITALPDSIGQLASLEEMEIKGTQINNLPETIGNLTTLKSLVLNESRITSLPESIGKLSALEKLCLYRTDVSTLPNSLRHLTKMKILDLDGTCISSLPDWLGLLPALQHLDLAHLILDLIPKSLTMRGMHFTDDNDFNYSKTGINLYHTVLRDQDISIFLETPELIPELYQAQQVSLKECRVIFLGDGASGKSYTIRRFREEGRRETDQDPYRTSETPGVEILDYPARWEGENFTLHFWDFGGQQLLHAMHRCFLTQDSCYVVTVKTRETKADQRARYWLRNVEAFAPGSPVLLFVNCWDNDDGKRAIDEPGLRADFPNLKDVRYCSARNAEQAEFQKELMEPILGLAAAEGGFRRPVPQAWNRVRLALRERRRAGESFLTKEAYHALCRESGVEDGNAPALLTLFNSLGVCFSYHRDREKRELAAYRLLDPVWLTNALYAIIEEGMSQAQEGRIRLAAIEDMLDNSGPQRLRGQSYRRTRPELCYRREECRYILEVAEAYQLCYRVDEGTYFFPALCPNNTPAEAASCPEDWPRQGSYLFRYAYLPDSVVHRLMVRFLRKDFSVKHCWLKGMVLALPEGFRAVLRMVEDRDLRLELFSAADRPISELFPLLREEILGVNRDLNLTARELIAAGKDEFPVAQLLRYHQRGDESCFGDKTDREYGIRELLEPFFDPWTLANLEAAEGSIRIRPYEYHRVPKSNPYLRRAIWEEYRKKCVYCGQTLMQKEIEIDHVLATNRVPDANPGVKLYLAQLKQRGVDLEKPDYVENYLLSCKNCNDTKNNKTWELESLRHYHDMAMEHTPGILQKMEKYAEGSRWKEE